MIANNIYTKIKDIFINEDDVSCFVNLDKSMMCYSSIMSAITKPLKLILFYGEPGTGKTFLLRKIISDLSGKKDIVFFPHPFFSEQNFIEALCDRIFNKTKIGIDSFETLIKECDKDFKNKNEILENQILIILDEAQLYPQELIEKIRLLADTRLFKFLFTIHKTNDGDALAKDYFTTRVWESIELKPANQSEVTLYIQKRMVIEDCERYLKFDDSDYALIYEFSKGNLRTVNKIMYKYFEICEYYDKFEPSKLANQSHTKKIITMSAIDAGLVDA